MCEALREVNLYFQKVRSRRPGGEAVTWSSPRWLSKRGKEMYWGFPAFLAMVALGDYNQAMWT